MRRGLLTIVTAVLLLAVFAGGCQTEPASEPAPTEEPTPAAVTEREQFIAACRFGAEPWAEEMEAIHSRWLRSMEAATSANEVELGLALIQLRRANRDASSVEPPACIRSIHQEYTTGQSVFIDFFTELLADPELDFALYADQIEEGRQQILGLEFALEVYRQTPDTFAEGLWEDKVLQEQQAGGGEPSSD